MTMRITKIGHCCLLIETNGVRILTDPGTYSDGQDQLTGIDLVLITHEHADHFHVESLKRILANNPGAQIRTNQAVGKLLDAQKIPYELLADGQRETFKGVSLKGIGKLHAEMHATVPRIENTGYFIGKRFFYPGDAFIEPPAHAEILALPVAGPWMTIADAIAYAQKIKPRTCFPVHDAMLRPDRFGSVHALSKKILSGDGIEFIVIDEMQSHDFG
jgi:L-ascorbate metabolism protein UlaG (beta-lactamase superfamily)